MIPIKLDHRLLESYAFALIDPLQADDTSREPWEAFPQWALVPPGLEAQRKQFPKLLDLRRAPRESRDLLVKLLLEQPLGPSTSLCVALLKTQASGKQMVSHFSYLLAPRSPTNQRGVFRFYDPTVYEHLTWMLDQHSFGLLFGPVETWTVPLRGTWFTQLRPTDSRPNSPRFFRLKADSRARISRIGRIHAVLKQKQEWASAPADWGPMVEALLIRAEHHQLADKEDAVAFATSGLRWHTELDRHPRIKQLIGRSQAQPKRFARLVNGFTETDWQVIAAELDSNNASAIETYDATTDPLTAG